MLLQPADKQSHTTDTKNTKYGAKQIMACRCNWPGTIKRHDVFGLLPLHNIVPNAESFDFGRSDML